MAPRTRAPAPAKPKNGWAGSADQWRRRAGPHDLTCPSGMPVSVRLLGLATLARMDSLPEDLNEAVLLHLANHDRGGLAAVIGEEMLAAARGDDAAAERAGELTRKLGELTKRLVCEALVAPKLSVDELDGIPEGDLEFLMRVVTGRQPFDAAGRRIGVEPLEPWEPFRRQHGCAADCPRCEAARGELSTVHLDEL